MCVLFGFSVWISVESTSRAIGMAWTIIGSSDIFHGVGLYHVLTEKMNAQHESWELCFLWRIPVTQMVKNLPAMRETRLLSLGQKDPLEKGMATLSGILDWRIPWTEEPTGLQSIGPHRVEHSWLTTTTATIATKCCCYCYYYPEDAILQDSLSDGSEGVLPRGPQRARLYRKFATKTR